MVDSKDNEIGTIPKLLELLNLKRATVTIDAIGCHKEIAGQILQAKGNHGRIETRRVWVCDEIKWLRMADQWPGLRQMVMVQSRREVQGKVTTERRYYMASHRKLDAQPTATAIGGHWGIENQVHGVLDVTFNEDQSRIRRENGPENFSRLRRMVLNKLRAYEDRSGKKPSVRMKRKKCGWSFDYFLKVLTA
jgi:predicted transposase YbfD/YdcC